MLVANEVRDSRRSFEREWNFFSQPGHLIAVEQFVSIERELMLAGRRQLPVAHQPLEVTVMVAEAENQFTRGAKPFAELPEQFFQRRQREGFLHDVAQHHEPSRLILMLEFCEPVGRVVVDDRQQGAVRALGPGVSKMQIGHGQRPRRRKKHRSPRIQHEAAGQGGGGAVGHRGES